MTEMRDQIVLDEVDFYIKKEERTPFRRRRSPIIATLLDVGISDVEIQKMMEAGMNMVRFKMANFTKESLRQIFDKIDIAASKVAARLGVSNWPVGKCIELKTSIIRTGLLENQERSFTILPNNTEVCLTNNKSYFNKCSSKLIYIDELYISTEIKVGMEIFMNEDELSLVCQEIIDSKTVRCTVKSSGRLENLATVNIRGKKEARPTLKKIDKLRIDFALENNVDVIIINFVHSTEIIKQVKQYIAKKGAQRLLILSGICTNQGIEIIDDILKESDGLIVSREFLPFQMQIAEFYRLNNIQKWIAAKCLQTGKPLYLSGGVFNDSIEYKRIYQSEVLDAANALLGGVTGFILRNCLDVDVTTNVIKILNDLCLGIEPYATSKKLFWNLAEQKKAPVTAAEASLMSCVAMANQVNARVIVLPTVTGRTVKAIYSMRPSCLVIAVCNKRKLTRMLFLYRGIVPILCDAVDPEERIAFAIRYGVRRKWLYYNDFYVTLQRSAETSNFSDCVRVWTVKYSDKPLIQCTEQGEELPSSHVSEYNIYDKKHK